MPGSQSDERRPAAARIAAAAAGDHICWLYEDTDEFLAVLGAYAREGLRRNEKIALFLPEPNLTRVLSDLPDAARLITNGALVAMDAREAYTPGGIMDPDARLAGWVAMLDQAERQGFAGARVAGDVGWILNDPGARARWSSYELRAEILASRRPFTALCTYDVRIADPAGLAAVRTVHGVALGETQDDPGFFLHGRDGGLAISGELDALACEQMLTVSLDAAGVIAPATIDVSQLRFVDVAGMRAIGRLVDELSRRGGPVRLLGASPTFKKVWTLLSLDTLTPAELN